MKGTPFGGVHTTPNNTPTVTYTTDHIGNEFLRTNKRRGAERSGRFLYDVQVEGFYVTHCRCVSSFFN